MSEPLYLIHRIDCEATQPAVADAALGRRSTLGFAEVLEAHGLKGSFYGIPSELEANADSYLALAQRGHEIGLHIHPADLGYGEFLGVYGPEVQREIVSRSLAQFTATLQRQATGICLGYGSSNDHTRPLLVELGFAHGMTQFPGRILPECASVAAGAHCDLHYPHRYNRVLTGDLDFVETPGTCDPESRMWGGKHPQDLRVELVDAKNHYYTIRKAVARQVAEAVPVKMLHASTHNLFEFGKGGDFRRETLIDMIAHVFNLAAEFGLEVIAATTAEAAAAYRATVPLPQSVAAPVLDRRGHGAK